MKNYLTNTKICGIIYTYVEGDFINKFCWNCLFCRKKNIVNCYMCKNLENKLYPSWSNLKYEIPIVNKLFIYKNKRKKK